MYHYCNFEPRNKTKKKDEKSNLNVIKVELDYYMCDGSIFFFFFVRSFFFFRFRLNFFSSCNNGVKYVCFGLV